MVVIRENVEDIKAYIDFARQYKQSHINLVRMQVYPEMQVERMTRQEEQQVLKELIQYGQERKVRVRTVNRRIFCCVWLLILITSACVLMTVCILP